MLLGTLVIVFAGLLQGSGGWPIKLMRNQMYAAIGLPILAARITLWGNSKA